MSNINKRIEIIRKKIGSTETDAVSGVWYFCLCKQWILFCGRPQTKFGARYYFHTCLSVHRLGGSLCRGGLRDTPPRTGNHPVQ